MVPLLFTFSNYGLLIVRLITGVIFIAHGWPKFQDRQGTAAWFDSMGFKPGAFWAMFIAVLEVGGGFLLIAGFFTQVIALLLAIEMLVATLRVKRKMGLVNGYELDLALMAACIALVVSGAGEISIDNFFRFLLY